MIFSNPVRHSGSNASSGMDDDALPSWADSDGGLMSGRRMPARRNGGSGRPPVDSSFFDSSWELRRGLEVAELAQVPSEWGDLDDGGSAAFTQLRA